MGLEATFGMIRHPGASAVPITDDGQVVLLRQYRLRQAAAVSCRHPGRGRRPLASMQQELGEEAGYSAALDPGADAPCPGPR